MAAADDEARRRAAAFARIRQWGDAVLRMQAREVDAFDDVLRRQAAEMLRIMDEARGVGLAAPQVGVTNRVFAYRPGREEEGLALVNPVIVERSEETVAGLEGCLSLGRARVHVVVDRARGVFVEAQDVDGAPVRVEAEDFHARVLQHEIDHLDGVLMLARTDPDQRRAAVRALRADEPYEAPWPPGGEDGDAAA
jgi:peptide deformylase